MSKTALNLFPSHVTIGTLQADGSVLPSQAFVRAMSALFSRVGGATGASSEDLALMAMIDQGAALAFLYAEIAELRAKVGQLESPAAGVAVLRRKLDGVEQMATHRDPYRVNWERPGRIGFFTPNTGAFTTVNKLTLTPPTNGATFTLSDGKTFTVVSTIALAGADSKTLTVMNTMGFTATEGAFLDIGNGGALGSAAYQPTTAFAARSTTSLGAAPTDPATTQAAVITIQNVLRSVGIGS